MPVDILSDRGITSDGPMDILADKGISGGNQNSNRLLDYVTQSLKQSPKTFENTVLNAGDEANNSVRRLANMLAPQGMQAPMFHSGDEGAGSTTGQLLGNLPLLLAGGGALNGARGAAEAAPYLGKLAEYLGGSRLAPTAARQGLGGSLYGASQDPNNRLEGAITGGLAGAATPALLEGAKSLTPSSLFRGSLSPKELQSNLDLTEGTQTGLGDVLGSPSLKGLYENVAQKVPLSGGDEASANTAAQVVGKGNSILAKYLGDTAPEQVNDKLGQALKKAMYDQNKLKGNLYTEVEDLADKSGLKLTLPTFGDQAKKYSQLINDQNFLKFEPDAKVLLSKLSNFQSPVKTSESSILDESGKPFTQDKYPSLKESNILAGRLNQMARQYGASPASEDRNTGKVLGNLGSSLKSDIKTSINESGDDDLIKKFSDAEKNYKDNFSPFLDKDVYKFTHGGKDPDDLISTFIKTGSTTDKGNQLSKLVTKLDPKSQDLAKYAYLSRALKGAEENRNIDPNSFKTIWSDNKLGPRQKKALFPDASERKELDDFSKLTKMNAGAINRMFNPDTGQKNLLPMLFGHALGASAGSVEGYRHGGVPGAVGGLVSGFGAPILGARMLTKALTSPQIRQNLVGKMLSPKSTKNTSMLNTIAQSLVNQFRNGGQK